MDSASQDYGILPRWDDGGGDAQASVLAWDKIWLEQPSGPTALNPVDDRQREPGPAQTLSWPGGAWRGYLSRAWARPLGKLFSCPSGCSRLRV